MTAMNTPDTRLLDALFHPGDGLIELRALPMKPGNRAFVRPGDMDAVQLFIKKHKHENCYFGVAARKDSSSGDLGNCSVIRAIFADLDFKDIPEAEARAALENFPLPVSILVNSGGGFHAYWLLQNPFDLQKDAEKFKKLLKATARALRADQASAEPVHILRLPGTFNFKKAYGQPREVRLV